MELITIKEYLRVDNDDENSLITSLQKAAEEYLLNAGIKKDYTRELYKLAILMLISHWYENRNIVIVGTISKEVEMSIGTIMLQLKYTQGTVI